MMLHETLHEQVAVFLCRQYAQMFKMELQEAEEELRVLSIVCSGKVAPQHGLDDPKP